MPETGLRVWGNIQLAPSKIIDVGANDTIILTLNSVDYTITLDAGEYETSHERFNSKFIDHVNAKLQAASCPVTAKVAGIHDDTPRTVILFEVAEISETSTLGVGGTGGTSFVGTPFKTDPAVVLAKTSATTDKAGNIGVRAEAKADSTGSVSVRLEGSDPMASTLEVNVVPTP
jgi:hypothetical protein